MRTPEQQADFDLLKQLVDQVDGRLAHRAFDSLTEPERTLWSIWWLEAEVNNGGFDQYFFNDAGDLAGDAAPALRRIGATRCADIVAAAIAVFPPPGPSSNRQERQEQLMRLSEEQTEKLEILDNRFFEYPDPLESLLADFVRRHSSAFPQESQHIASNVIPLRRPGR